MTDTADLALPHLADLALGAPESVCRDCFTLRGTRHKDVCGDAACRYSGIRLHQCDPGNHTDGWHDYDCTPTVFDGWPTGNADAARADLWFRRWHEPETGDSGGFVCSVEDVDAEPDSSAIRLFTNCTWSPEQERWVRRD